MGIDWGQVFRGYVPTAMQLQREDESTRRWQEEQAARKFEADRANAFRDQQMGILQKAETRAQGQYDQSVREREEANARKQRLGAATSRYQKARGQLAKGDYGFIPEVLQGIGYNEDRPPFNNGRGAHYVGTDYQGNPMVQEYDLKTWAPVGAASSYTPAQLERILHDAYMAEVANIDLAAYTQAQAMALKQGELGVHQRNAATNERRAATEEWQVTDYMPARDAAQRTHATNLANIQMGPAMANLNDRRAQDTAVVKINKKWGPTFDMLRDELNAALESKDQARIDSVSRKIIMQQGGYQSEIATATRRAVPDINFNDAAVARGGGRGLGVEWKDLGSSGILLHVPTNQLFEQTKAGLVPVKMPGGEAAEWVKKYQAARAAGTANGASANIADRPENAHIFK